MTEGEVRFQIQQILADVYTFPGVAIWFKSRNRNLAMACPNDLIRAGEYDLVLAEARRVAGS